MHGLLGLLITGVAFCFLYWAFFIDDSDKEGSQDKSKKKGKRRR